MLSCVVLVLCFYLLFREAFPIAVFFFSWTSWGVTRSFVRRKCRNVGDTMDRKGRGGFGFGGVDAQLGSLEDGERQWVGSISLRSVGRAVTHWLRGGYGKFVNGGTGNWRYDTVITAPVSRGKGGVPVYQIDITLVDKVYSWWRGQICIASWSLRGIMGAIASSQRIFSLVW